MSSGTTMQVVRNLDLERYMGRWYEIASFRSRFQPRDGRDTRATYSLADDGATVRVLNETWTGGGGGNKRGFISGTAYKPDPSSDEAKFKVRFYVPPFLPVIPITGDYWVLHIDEAYTYALIGQPSRNYLWILCRENRMDEEVYEMLLKKAADVGYDVKKLIRTSHSETPPPATTTDGEPSASRNDDAKGVWWIKSLLGL